MITLHRSVTADADRSKAFAYLSDFGIARQVAAGSRAAGGFVPGTPSHMAPELHRGEPAGPMSDVYALGCLLWAALTGRAPYAGWAGGGLG